MDFAQFYQNGGITMHLILMVSAVAGVFLLRSIKGIRNQRDVNPMLDVIVGLTGGAFLFGLFGALTGFIEIGAALQSVDMEQWPFALSRGVPIALYPLTFAAMCGTPLALAVVALRYTAARKAATPAMAD